MFVASWVWKRRISLLCNIFRLFSPTGASCFLRSSHSSSNCHKASGVRTHSRLGGFSKRLVVCVCLSISIRPQGDRTSAVRYGSARWLLLPHACLLVTSTERCLSIARPHPPTISLRIDPWAVNDCPRSSAIRCALRALEDVGDLKGRKPEVEINPHSFFSFTSRYSSG